MKHSQFSLSVLAGLMTAASAEGAASGSAEATTNTTSAPVPAGKFRFTFSFKGKKEAELTTLLAGYDEASQTVIAGEFEAITRKDKAGNDEVVYKRKAVTVDLDLPTHVQAPDYDGLTRQLVESMVTDFVKAEYIDNFLEVSQHDWAFITAKMAEVSKRGGKLSLDVSDELWNLAADSFGDYIAKKTGRAVIGDRLKAAFKGKFSMTALSRNLQDTSNEIMGKIKLHLEGWAAHVAENDADNADSFATIFQYLTDKLTAQDAKAKINFLDVL